MVNGYCPFLSIFPEFYPVLRNCFQKTLTEAGCDEAGRGCFAGPVFAAAVILPADFFHPELNDSKLVAPAIREKLRIFIESSAVSFAVALADHTEIDRTNILKASFRAMHRAIGQLSVKPGLLLIDGNRFTRYPNIPHRCIVKGDSIYAAIAAASILAKTYRDAYMLKLHDQFPHYNWKENKGYGTQAHREAIRRYGLCKYHRKSFKILPEQPSLDY